MNLRLPLLWFVIFMIALMFPHLSYSAEASQRDNVLAKHFPEGLAGLSVESRQIAAHYGIAWMRSMSSVSGIGLKNADKLQAFQEKEFLPILLPLKDGNKVEKDAFAAGIKIYEAVHYLALKLTGKTDKEDTSMDALLRYKPGNENIGGALTNGIGELLDDYMQMLDPDLFEKALKLRKDRQY